MIPWPSRARASTAPVTELRRKSRLSWPDNSRALTIRPSASVTLPVSYTHLFRTQGFERLFLAHPEAMLFVNDHEPQTTELDVLLQQLVRSDDDVHLAFGEFLERLRRFLSRLEAREFGDANRPVVAHLSEAVAEGLEVLFAEQRGRAQHSDLLAASHGAKRGAQSDFGLAEADVAANQPIHRTTGFHVVDYGVDGGCLIGRFLKAEAVGKGVVVVRREFERMALARSAQGVERHQFRCRVPRLQGGATFGLLPLRCAERVQGSGIRVRRGVT